ncbi:DUF3216 domain-containing protein [Thermococcus sp.]|uniref:DUF3216 domain-containing protein n=1 Tax=Thermococcus sp. TaxID=35749 RepID=UPI0025DF1A3F|nr:DUF3216 domain-containing protein [Thermococcus sp.]
MSIDVPEVGEVRKLLEDLGEGSLVERLDSFMTLNEGLENKRGREFIEVSVLAFLQGVLTTLRLKYPENEKLASLHEMVKNRREELDAMFRKANPPIFGK